MTFLNITRMKLRRIGGYISNAYNSTKKILTLAPGMLDKSYRAAKLGVKLLPETEQKKVETQLDRGFDKGNKTIEKLQEFDNFIQQTREIFI